MASHSGGYEPQVTEDGGDEAVVEAATAESGADEKAQIERGYLETDQLSEQEQLQRFLNQMDDYTPTIPDAVTNYYLRTAGFDCPDERVVRLVSLAAQKFVSDIANEVMQKQKANLAVQHQKNKAKGGEKKYVMTMDDLQFALGQQGIHVSKPAYLK